MSATLNSQGIAGFVSSALNLAASAVFFAYVGYRVIMDSCGLRSFIRKKREERRNARLVKKSTQNAGIASFSDFDLENGNDSVKKVLMHPSFDSKGMRRKAFRFRRRKIAFLNQSMRFLIYLQFFSMGMCFDKIVGLFNQYRVFCVTQALFLHIFGIEMHLWSLVISVYLLFTAIILPHSQKNNPKIHWAFEIVAHMVVHPLTALLASLPHIFGVVGETSGWCWIDTNTYPKVGNILVFASFFGPVWIIMLLTLIAYCIVFIWVIRSIHRTKSVASYLKNEKQLKLTVRLILYPGISLLVWVIPTVNRFLFTVGYPIRVFQILHSFCISLNGFLIVIVFFLNPLRHLKLLFMCSCLPLYLILRTSKKNAKKNSIRNFGDQNILEKVQYLAKHGDEYEDELSTISTFSEDKRTAFMDSYTDEDEFSDSELPDSPLSIPISPSSPTGDRTDI